jgi:hypothetical protein
VSQSRALTQVIDFQYFFNLVRILLRPSLRVIKAPQSRQQWRAGQRGQPFDATTNLI